MADLDTEFFVGKKLADNIFYIEVKEGVEVKKETAQRSVEMMVNLMATDFAMLINRVNDYSVDPLSIYSYLNSIEPLKAIAIVVHRESYLELMDGQQLIYNNPLRGFLTVEEANTWLEQLMRKKASSS